MTAVLPEQAEQVASHVCWTDDYCLHHCETYRVCGPDGTVGYVEEVLVSADEETVEALVVRRRDSYEQVLVPAELIESIDPARECLYVTEVNGDDE